MHATFVTAAKLPALAWDSRNFYDARNAAKAPRELVAIPGAGHFTILFAPRLSSE
jgi:pimeloyl-ACP methyl ester carboxylesterase